MKTKRKKIVVTGGPGGGKTTALDLFQREFMDKVKIVPEAATILYKSGLSRETETERLLLLQKSIFDMQITMEDIYRRLHDECLLVCDRGTLDGLAYWPLDEESFFKKNNTDLETEMGKYDAVIFFQTGATYGQDMSSNNPYRSEDNEKAIRLDEKLKQVWERHPNFHYIPSDTSFMRKITHGLLTINGVLQKLGIQ